MTKMLLALFLFSCFTAWGPALAPELSDTRSPSIHLLTVVVCEEGSGGGCRAHKAIANAPIVIDDRYAGRTNDDGVLTTTVQHGWRWLSVGAVGYAGQDFRVEVRADAQCDVALTAAPASVPRGRARARSLREPGTPLTCLSQAPLVDSPGSRAEKETRDTGHGR